MTLTFKQSMLVEHYLENGGNGTKAAIAAGYSKTRAAAQACNVLALPEAQALIAQRLEQVAMSSNEVLAHLTAIARGTEPERAIEHRQVKRFRQRTTEEPDGTIIRDMEVELLDRVRALELLGKYHKLFTDKAEVITGSELHVKVTYVRNEAQ